ncbi:DUF3784 domain-containing protein [Ruminococcaceae bacterium OttesenSCG-928-I18]|nr:DUF3784 domain-containing protein [Ruminococcaceae bacterium OttesenSCG-928-I18]
MDQLSVYIIGLVVLIPIFIMSIVLMTGRGSSLVAGYNTMSAEEQKKWDEKALCRFLGKLLFLFTLFIGLAMVASAHDRDGVFGVFTTMAMAELIGGVIYANKSRRFRQK